MFEYIKMAVSALICGVMMPLPVSSSSHFSFLNTVMNYTGDKRVLSFYFAVFSMAFTVVVFFNLRKIYSKVFKSLFSSNDKSSAASAYRKVGKNVFLSLLPLILLYIPVAEDALVIDYFDEFILSGSGFILNAFACVMNALVILVAMWYTKQKNAPTLRGATTKTVVRSSIYQLVGYVVPGMSKITLGSVNMLICDVEPKVIMRDVYMYLAPQMFVVSLVKIIRGLVVDVVVDPLAIIIGAVISIVSSAVIIHFVSKVNMRKLLGFFAGYSAMFAVAVFVMSLI